MLEVDSCSSFKQICDTFFDTHTNLQRCSVALCAAHGRSFKLAKLHWKIKRFKWQLFLKRDAEIKHNIGSQERISGVHGGIRYTYGFLGGKKILNISLRIQIKSLRSRWQYRKHTHTHPKELGEVVLSNCFEIWCINTAKRHTWLLLFIRPTFSALQSVSQDSPPFVSTSTVDSVSRLHQKRPQLVLFTYPILSTRQGYTARQEAPLLSDRFPIISTPASPLPPLRHRRR